MKFSSCKKREPEVAWEVRAKHDHEHPGAKLIVARARGGRGFAVRLLTGIALMLIAFAAASIAR